MAVSTSNAAASTTSPSGGAAVTEILGVTSIALEYGADEGEAIAALLHGANEDAPEELGVEAVRTLSG